LERSFFRIVGAEFVAEEISIRAGPTLHAMVLDAKWLPAVSAFCGRSIFEFV
jgi:hypothetical protein